MRDKLISLLGGISLNEYKFLEKQLGMMRSQSIAISSNNEYLKETIRLKDERICYLEEIIFREHGIVDPENSQTSQQQENLRPINTKPRSIFATMRAMQKDDRLRAASSKQEAKSGA